MTQLVLFHHAQGLTPGITAFADGLRAAGHDVHTPELFDGRTFDSIEAGMAHVRELGFDEVMERGTRGADAVGDNLVFADNSLPSYDADATELLLRRVIDFPGRIRG